MILQATPLRAMQLNLMLLRSMASKVTAILMVLLHIALLKASILLTILLNLAMEPPATSAAIPPHTVLQATATTLLRISPAHIRIRALQPLILRPRPLPTPPTAPTSSSTGPQPLTCTRLNKTGALQPPCRMRTRQLPSPQLLTLLPLRLMRFPKIGRPLQSLPDPVLSPSSLLRLRSKLRMAPDPRMDTVELLASL